MGRFVRQGMIVLLGLIWLSGTSLATTGAPTAFIQRTTDSIVQVFSAPDLQGEERRQERLTRLQHIAGSAFDWEEIARRALASHWRDRTPQERQEFTALFREAVEGMYLERLEAAARQRLRERPAILYKGEQADGERAVVRTAVTTPRLREIPMDYRLRQADGQWRIYDIVIAGVSLVSNYRTQFHRIITQSSYQGLVQQLQARQLGEVLAEPPQSSR
jgi:phospholipid transport system substrate-binding protein